jgi:hypothetical protein
VPDISFILFTKMHAKTSQEGVNRWSKSMLNHGKRISEMNWQSGVRRPATPARFLTAQRQNHCFFAPTKRPGKIKDHAKTVQQKFNTGTF